ncbi:hypothetical protein FGB62_2g04 [Gracilaria domingensis]|nr:hypothetical protein FGB62_2g04 [Gracilaria domingensis]
MPPLAVMVQNRGAPEAYGSESVCIPLPTKRESLSAIVLEGDMASSPVSTGENAFNPSLRSLCSTIEGSQTVYNDRPRQESVQPSGGPDIPQLFPHISLVSRRATFTSIDSFRKQAGQFRKDQAQMQMLKRNFKSILSFMRSRSDSEETYRKKSKLESDVSPQTSLDHSDDSYDDSDEIPWFGANEATILAGRAASSAPKQANDIETEMDDITDEASDDYVAFQSSTKRRRILSMFDRQEKIVASAALDSFESDTFGMNMDELYELFTWMEATSTTPPSLKRRINGRRAKFGISRSTRSMFKRL